MPAPSKVEFPGQKKTKARMKGTKQANEATAKKLARELGQFRENPAKPSSRHDLLGKTSMGAHRPGDENPL